MKDSLHSIKASYHVGYEWRHGRWHFGCLSKNFVIFWGLRRGRIMIYFGVDYLCGVAIPAISITIITYMWGIHRMQGLVLWICWDIQCIVDGNQMNKKRSHAVSLSCQHALSIFIFIALRFFLDVYFLSAIIPPNLFSAIENKTQTSINIKENLHAVFL